MKEVLAIVVTFKRPQILQQCLEGLGAQQNKDLGVHVVINSDDDETLNVIDKFKGVFEDMTFERYDNVGPAGGFHYGLKTFLEGSYTYAWLMDDDIVPDSRCLEHLIKSAQRSLYVFPRVFKSEGSEVISFGWWGLMLHRSLVKRVGLPMKELFYWIEDTEYLLNRVSRVYGFGPLRSTEATVHHRHQRSSHYPSWYYYYAVRNNLYYRTRIVSLNWTRMKRTAIIYAKFLGNIIFREPNKFQKLYMLILGTYHGAVGKLGKIVDPLRYP